MAIVKLEYKLPEETYAFNAATHGAKWRSVVYELANELRTKTKYGHEYKTADDALEGIKDFLWTELHDEGLDPYEE